MVDVVMIIPQRNQVDLTIECVRSLRSQDERPWPVLIVDDGSDAAQLRRLQGAKLRGADVLSLPPGGVTAAWNAAYRRLTDRGGRQGVSGARLESPGAGGRDFHPGISKRDVYVENVSHVRGCDSLRLIFLNNDTVSTGAWVERLVKPLDEAGTLMTGVEWRTERLLPQPLLERLPTQMFLAGWCFALRASDLRRVAGFDAAMKVYFSDTDLQCRLLLARQAAFRGRDRRTGWIEIHPTPAVRMAPANPLVAIDGLPLRHLGHQTARLDPQRRAIWSADRRAFITRSVGWTSVHRDQA